MPLENIVTLALANAGAAAVAHGLTHNGASRTPDLVAPVQWTAGTWQGSWSMTYDSVTLTVFTGVAQSAFVVGFLVKRCHSVEDRSGTF